MIHSHPACISHYHVSFIFQAFIFGFHVKLFSGVIYFSQVLRKMVWMTWAISTTAQMKVRRGRHNGLIFFRVPYLLQKRSKKNTDTSLWIVVIPSYWCSLIVPDGDTLSSIWKFFLLCSLCFSQLLAQLGTWSSLFRRAQKVGEPMSPMPGDSDAHTGMYSVTDRM